MALRHALVSCLSRRSFLASDRLLRASSSSAAAAAFSEVPAATYSTSARKFSKKESHKIAQTIKNMKMLNKEEISYIQKALDEKLGPNKQLVQFLLQGLKEKDEAKQRLEYSNTLRILADQAEALVEEKTSNMTEKKSIAIVVLLISYLGYKYVYQPPEEEELSLDELAKLKIKEVLDKGHITSALEQDLEKEASELIEKERSA